MERDPVDSRGFLVSFYTVIPKHLMRRAETSSSIVMIMTPHQRLVSQRKQPRFWRDHKLIKEEVISHAIDSGFCYGIKNEKSQGVFSERRVIWLSVTAFYAYPFVSVSWTNQVDIFFCDLCFCHCLYVFVTFIHSGRRSAFITCGRIAMLKFIIILTDSLYPLIAYCVVHSKWIWSEHRISVEKIEARGKGYMCNIGGS